MSFSSFLGKSFLAQADFCEASYDSLPVPKSFLSSLSETTSGNNHNQSLVTKGSSPSDEPPTVPAVVSVLPLPEETSKGRTGLGAGVKGYTSVVTRVVDNFVNIDPDAEGIRKVEEQQKAERLAELRDAATVAAIRSKFPEPSISSSANKQTTLSSSSHSNSKNNNSGSGPRNSLGSSPLSRPSALHKDDEDGESNHHIQTHNHKERDAGLTLVDSKEEIEVGSGSKVKASAHTHTQSKMVGKNTSATPTNNSLTNSDSTDSAQSELKMLLEIINESPAVRAILLARSPELAELIDGTRSGKETMLPNSTCDIGGSTNTNHDLSTIEGSHSSASLSSSASTARAAALKFLAENKNNETLKTVFQQQKQHSEDIVEEISPLKAPSSSEASETVGNSSTSTIIAATSKDNATAEEVLARLDAVLSRAMSSIGDKYHELRSPSSSIPDGAITLDGAATGNIEAVSPPSSSFTTNTTSGSSSSSSSHHTEHHHTEHHHTEHHHTEHHHGRGDTTHKSVTAVPLHPSTPNPLLPSRIPIYIGRLSQSQSQPLHHDVHDDTHHDVVDETLVHQMRYEEEEKEELRPLPASTVNVLRGRENAISEAQRQFRLSQILGEPSAPTGTSSSTSNTSTKTCRDESAAIAVKSAALQDILFSTRKETESNTSNASRPRSRPAALEASFSSSSSSSSYSTSSIYPESSLSPRVDDLAARLRASEDTQEEEKKSEERLGGVSASVERRYAAWKEHVQQAAAESDYNTSTSPKKSYANKDEERNKSSTLSSTSSSSSLASELREIQSLLKAAKDINFKALMPHTSEMAAVAIAKNRSFSESGAVKPMQDFPILPQQPNYSGPEILSPAMKSLLGRARAVLVEEEQNETIPPKPREERKLEFTLKSGVLSSISTEPPLSSISMFSDPVRASPPPLQEFNQSGSAPVAIIPNYMLSAARLQPINALADRALAAAASTTLSEPVLSSPRSPIRNFNIPPPVLLTSPMPSIDSREAAERPHLVFSTSSATKTSQIPSPNSSSMSVPYPSSAFGTQGMTPQAPHRVLSVHLPASTPQQPPTFGAEPLFRPMRSTISQHTAPSSSSNDYPVPPHSAYSTSAYSTSHVIDGGASSGAAISSRVATTSVLSTPYSSSLSSATPGRFSSALADILSPLKR